MTALQNVKQHRVHKHLLWSVYLKYACLQCVVKFIVLEVPSNVRFHFKENNFILKTEEAHQDAVWCHSALTRVRICAANMQIHVPRRKSSCNRLTSLESSCRRKRKFLLGTQTPETSLRSMGNRHQTLMKTTVEMKAKSYIKLKMKARRLAKSRKPKTWVVLKEELSFRRTVELWKSGAGLLSPHGAASNYGAQPYGSLRVSMIIQICPDACQTLPSPRPPS